MKAILILHQPESLYEKSLNIQNQTGTQEAVSQEYVENYYSLRTQALQRLRQVYPSTPIFSQSYMDDEPEDNHFQPKNVKNVQKDLQAQGIIKGIKYLGSRRKSLPISDFFSMTLQFLTCNMTEAKSQHYQDGKKSTQIENTMANDAISKDDCFYLFYGWYPFLDPNLCEKIQQLHDRFRAHMSYGENIPDGFVPDLVNKEFLNALIKGQITNIRSFAFSNLDQFDIEIFYKRPDLRHYRLNLTTQTHRACKTLENINQLFFPLQYENLETLLAKHPLIFRQYPAFLNIELTNKNQLTPFYLPHLKRAPDIELDPKILDKLILDIQQYAMIDDVTVCFGGLGEPTEYEYWLEYVEAFLALPQVKRIYLETFGYQIDEKILSMLNEMKNAQKLEMIIAMSTLDKKRYHSFYKQDLFETVMGNLKLCMSFLTNKTSKPNMRNFFVEMICMEENEAEIDSFMKFFHFDLLRENFHLRTDWTREMESHIRSREKKGILQPILAKPNSYLGLVKDRKISDLSPVARSFCWQLQRNMTITCEGKIPLCTQDPAATGALVGNLATQNISEIRKKQEKSYLIDQQGDYQKNKIACHACDEWHIFQA